MSNAECANALLRGEIDVNQYWRESGEQQVRSAGVFLTQQQQERALKNLARLACSLRDSGFCLANPKAASGKPSCGAGEDDLRAGFDRYLATLR